MAKRKSEPSCVQQSPRVVSFQLLVVLCLVVDKFYVRTVLASTFHPVRSEGTVPAFVHGRTTIGVGRIFSKQSVSTPVAVDTTVDSSRDEEATKNTSHRVLSGVGVDLPEYITTPLAPHTFAGKIEQGLVERYFPSHGGEGKEGSLTTPRVIQSWRLLEKDYVHEQYCGPPSLDPRESQCHQYCHSYVPGLTVQQFWDESQFDWCHKIQSRYKSILQEFQRVTADLETLTRQGNNIWAGALTDDASSYGKGWKTLVLMNRGHWDPVNVNLFPTVAKAVHDSGVPATEVFFAQMEPNSVIKPHSDFTNFVLTCHLPLVIPYSGQNKCRLQIGDETRQWIDGKLMLFDTSLRHSAVNESDLKRTILMMRVWHPDLSETERQALQYTFDCLDEMDLVSDDPILRQKAAERVEQMKQLPEIDKSIKRVQGFGSSGGGGSSKNGKKSKKKK